jgi:hypothetical protein
VWTANFAGTRDYQGVSFTGLVPGQTTFAQAATNFQNDFKSSTVAIAAPVNIPPNCTTAAQENAYQGGFDLSGILTFGLNCSQLHIVSIILQVTIGVVTISAGGGGAILDAVADYAAPEVVDGLKDVAMEQLDRDFASVFGMPRPT